MARRSFGFSAFDPRLFEFLHSPLFTRPSPLFTRHSPLFTRHSPLFTRHSPLFTRHYSKTYLSSNITNIISIGDVAVDGRQVERGGAAEGEPAMAVVDLLLEQGNGLGPGPPLGRVEEVQRVLAAGGKVLGDQVHVAGLDAGQPRLAQTGAGRLEQEVEPIAGNRQRSLAGAGMAGLVLDRDRQLARGYAVEPQLLDQPLEIADQPGVEDHRSGGRFAKASPPRQHLVRGALGVDRLYRVAIELPPEGLARGGQERPDLPPIGPRQVEAGGDAPGSQPGC